MKTVTLCDRTLALKANELSFKEKLELARSLDNLHIDGIEFGPVSHPRTDILLVRAVAAVVKNSVLCVNAGTSADGVELAAQALSAAAKPRLQVSLPLSEVCMEYDYHRKPEKMLALIASLTAAAKEKCADVEFCALDASRAEKEFLASAVQTAVEAGATRVTLCDTAGETMPDEFAAAVRAVCEQTKVPVAVSVNDKNGLAVSSAALALKAGASGAKTALLGTDEISFGTLTAFLKNCGGTQGLSCGVKQTELGRGLLKLEELTGKCGEAPNTEADAVPDAFVSPDELEKEIKSLGYELSAEDTAAVYREFQRVAAQKTVKAKELDAIVAAVALQVPPTYRLINYMTTSGNLLAASAQITLTKNGETLSGINTGDGPVDAAFRTIDQIIGRHYELDEFSVCSVTEGKEAVGSALVRLRAGGKLYAGKGVSTDILEAAVRAYLGAINKIVYEENEI